MNEKIIIDGKNATMGRLASYSAKQALLGKEVIIVNAKETLISGDKKGVIEKYNKLVSIGGSSLKGPKLKRTPERILKRVIRGMLSHKQGRGKEAIKRIKCYNEIPQEYMETKKIQAGKIKKGKFTTLEEVVKSIKG